MDHVLISVLGVRDLSERREARRGWMPKKRISVQCTRDVVKHHASVQG
jgi:hypothetical protein